jgi:hypothetical protein
MSPNKSKKEKVELNMSTVNDVYAGKIILLPWGQNTADEDKYEGDDVRCQIEQLGGSVAYADAPSGNRGHYGQSPSEATNEYVPTGATPRTQLPTLDQETHQQNLKSTHDQFAEFLKQHARSTFIPIASVSDNPGKESRYFGKPWMPTDMEWPTVDDEPMNFFLQLNIAELPVKPAGLAKHDGLMLVFGAEEYTDDDMFTVLFADLNKDGALRDQPDGQDATVSLSIDKWTEMIEHPHGESLEEIEGMDEFEDVQIGFGSDTIGMMMKPDGELIPEREAVDLSIQSPFHTFEADKLGGWPSWAQGDETPEDSRGEPMEVIYQFSYEQLLLNGPDPDAKRRPGYGVVHIFGSEKTGELAYAFACD